MGTGQQVLSSWWPASERGKVYGAYVFAAGMASVLAFATSTLILELDLGWRWIFRVPVLLLLVGGATYYFVVRDTPEELSFSPLPDEQPTGPQTKSQTGQDNDADVSLQTINETSRQRYLAALTNPRFLIACLAIGF